MFADIYTFVWGFFFSSMVGLPTGPLASQITTTTMRNVFIFVMVNFKKECGMISRAATSKLATFAKLKQVPKHSSILF